MESVLVGVDHSQNSRHAVRFALDRARVNRWRVRIVHVINWSQYSFAGPKAIEDRPRTLRAEIDRAQADVLDPILRWAEEEELLAGIDVVTAIRHGRPSEELAEFAVENGDDIVVVARTGESNLKRAIFGSTASRLAQHSDVPVVVVP
ncbi:universal stress protein [Nesterenkonia halophila]